MNAKAETEAALKAAAEAPSDSHPDDAEDADGDEKSSKKKDKKKRKPRGVGAYNVYIKEKVAEYKVKHASVPHKECFKTVATQWKTTVSQEDKDAYQKKANEINAEKKATAAAPAAEEDCDIRLKPMISH